MRDATEEDYISLKKTCNQMLEDENFAGFTSVNFINYTQYLNQLKVEFPKFKFRQTDFGISVDKI